MTKRADAAPTLRPPRLAKRGDFYPGLPLATRGAVAERRATIRAVMRAVAAWRRPVYGVHRFQPPEGAVDVDSDDDEGGDAVVAAAVPYAVDRGGLRVRFVLDDARFEATLSRADAPDRFTTHDGSAFAPPPPRRFAKKKRARSH